MNAQRTSGRELGNRGEVDGHGSVAHRSPVDDRRSLRLATEAEQVAGVGLVIMHWLDATGVRQGSSIAIHV